MSIYYFGVKFDTANMSLEELEKSCNNLQELLDIFKHEIAIRKISEQNHKNSSK